MLRFDCSRGHRQRFLVLSHGNEAAASRVATSLSPFGPKLHSSAARMSPNWLECVENGRESHRDLVIAARPKDLLEAIQLGHARDRARLDQERAMAELKVRFETLTPREREVMAFVVCGRSNKQIAADLGVSEITVKVHRGQVMRKMRASSLPDLARMADQLQLTPTKPRNPGRVA
jgi:DNA-binding NarL/FixJ family response regulator